MANIKMEYCGPNAEKSPRTIEVSPEESIALDKRGLYKRIAIKKTKVVENNG